MVAALGSLAPYLMKGIEYSPYIIAALGGLYRAATDLGDKYGPEIKKLYYEFRRADGPTRRKILAEQKDTLLGIASYAIYCGLEVGPAIYRILTKSLSPPEKKVPSTAVSIMIATLAISSYFALFAPSKTVHVIKPVSLDVVGHEITHGVTQHSADLIYQNEPGALNESFSDIFGTAVEFYKEGVNGDWLLGEDFVISGYGRSLQNPKSKNDAGIGSPSTKKLCSTICNPLGLTCIIGFLS